MTPKRKILVATTIYGDPRLGTVKYAYHQAVARLVGNADLDFLALPAGVQADIVRARSGIVRDALAYSGGTASGIFWLDEDVVAPAEVLGSLLTKLLDSGHDYCGVPYPKKRLHWDRVIEWFRTHDRAPTGAELAAAAFDYTATVMEQTEADKARGDGTVELPVVGGFAKVDRLGLGFTYTSRACLERMVRCYSNPNDSMRRGGAHRNPYLPRARRRGAARDGGALPASRAQPRPAHRRLLVLRTVARDRRGDPHVGRQVAAPSTSVRLRMGRPRVWRGRRPPCTFLLIRYRLPARGETNMAKHETGSEETITISREGTRRRRRHRRAGRARRAGSDARAQAHRRAGPGRRAPRESSARGGHGSCASVPCKAPNGATFDAKQARGNKGWRTITLENYELPRHRGAAARVARGVHENPDGSLRPRGEERGFQALLVGDLVRYCQNAELLPVDAEDVARSRAAKANDQAAE